MDGNLLTDFPVLVGEAFLFWRERYFDLLFSVTALLCVQNELEVGLVSNFLKELVELGLFSSLNVCNKTQVMILLI